MKARVRNKPPTTVKRTVRRGRLPNGHYRTREYLTEREIERLIKDGRPQPLRPPRRNDDLAGLSAWPAGV
jgi:hypothetical protein